MVRKHGRLGGGRKNRHTESLVGVGGTRVDGIIHWGLILLHGDLVLAGATSVVVVFGVAGRDVAADSVVLLLVLFVCGRHDDEYTDYLIVGGCKREDFQYVFMGKLT